MTLRTLLIISYSLSALSAFSQEENNNLLTFDEYLGYVKRYHPYVKQANLLLEEGQAKLLKARGAFDPKIEVDYDKKEFKNSTYYNKLNSSFKIPTWFGIEFKGGLEENSGTYLNPEAIVPDDGLYNVGVSIPLARNLLTNKRMASLRQSKIYRKQVIAERQLLVNSIISDASIAYFKWIKTFREQEIYETFLSNAKERLDGIKKNYELGENPAIDTLEAGIIYKNRKLALERARIAFVKSSLEVSNFLWLENNIPIELQPTMQPDINTVNIVDQVLYTSPLDVESTNLENHPKLRILENKYEIQQIEKRLMKNNLLPQIDLEHNFLTQQIANVNTFNTANYKTGVSVNLPLFLRKERGNLKIADLKLNDIALDRMSTRLNLKNKLDAVNSEITSYTTQQSLTSNIVNDYSNLLTAEERKFELGESSLFLINSRESKLIEAKLKAIKIENESLNTRASLFQIVNTVK